MLRIQVLTRLEIDHLFQFLKIFFFLDFILVSFNIISIFAPSIFRKMNFENMLPYAFALIIALPIIFLLRQFVFTYINLKNKELKLLAVKANGDLKMQAYERMTLFLERIKPSNLVNKFDKDLAIHEFIYLLEKNISEESKILCDNDLFYPVMVQSKKSSSYFYQLTETYESALRYPNLYVDYIIVAHPETFYYRNDKMKALVTAIYAGNYNTQLNHKIVFSNSFVQIIKLVRFENHASNE